MVPTYGAKLLDSIITHPTSILDVGVGGGATSWKLCKYGFKVTGISLADPPFKHENYTHIKDRFENTDLNADIVWCSHVLEHVPNIGLFIEKLIQATDKTLCVVVPNDPTSLLVAGHLSFWTPAHLMYNLVVNGLDCREAKYYTHGRDIGLKVDKVLRPEIELNYDRGDLKLLQPYFPCELAARKTNPWLGDRW